MSGRRRRPAWRLGIEVLWRHAVMLAAFAPIVQAQVPATAPVPATAQTPATVPVPAAMIAPETMFRRPEWSDVQLSPDATRLSALVPVAGRRNLAMVNLSTMAATSVVTTATDTDVASYTWLDNRRLVVELADIADASGRVVLRGRAAINADGSEPRRLDGLRGFAVVHRFMDDSGNVVISAYERSRVSPDAYLLDTRTGRKRLLTFENPGNVIQWIADHEGRVRVAVARDRSKGQTRFLYRATGDAPWRELARYRDGDPGQLSPIAFDFDNRTLFVHSSVGDRRAIFRYDPQTATLLGKVYESVRFDVAGLVLDYPERKVVGVRTSGASGGTVWLDAEWEKRQQAVDRALPGASNELSWGRDNHERLLVTSFSDVQPAQFWLLDTRSGQLQEQASSRKWIDPRDMSPMTTLRYRARDGLDIPSQLVIPKGSDGRNLPLVIMIHGGPYAPGYGWGFNPEAQFFAALGFAVLLPDFRGTTGYGRAFVEAGYRQWGRAMQDDITDGARRMIELGIADKSRICLYGGSYGGYAALMGLAREPKMFRCAVAYVAVTDLALLFDTGWSVLAGQDDAAAQLTRMVGDPVADRVALEETSPVKQAARITAPVLLAFGGEDRRVPLVHGVRLRDALRAGGKEVEWVMYPDEAHGFNKDENRFDFYRRVGAFLLRQLGAPR